MELRTEDFDYELPEELIAQEPQEEREMSRLLVMDRRSETLRDDHFNGLPTYLKAGDLLIANRSRVVPARLHGNKSSGGRVEILLLKRLDGNRWTVLARPSRKLNAGTTIFFPESSLQARFLEPVGKGKWTVAFEGVDDVSAELTRLGELPLPPYIRSKPADPERYQTVYADREGSIAAPTAGLHFSDAVLTAIRDRGVGIQYVTLHVGIGTFRPVTAERVPDHRMDQEWGEVPRSVARAANEARARGNRVIAVGTTTTRLLESACQDGQVQPFEGETDLFIYPGYRFRAIDALLTNFHLPRSTLLMLVSAFAGRERVLKAYREAIHRRYRFYSFGDAMLII